LSGIGWKLRRVAAMPPGEIAWRTRVALRDRLAPPRWSKLAAGEAFEMLYIGDPVRALRTSRLAEWLHVPEDADGFEAVLAEAAALGASRWTLFGDAVTLDDPPRWNRNPKTGDEWPDTPSDRIDYRRGGLAGDTKRVWELGRLTMLPDLALAARLTGSLAHAALAARWLNDWNARSRFGRGIHYTSGIEIAIRVITASLTLAWLEEGAAGAEPGPALGLIAQQARWCSDHLSLGSSANNHLIAEYAAITVAGALFPALRGGERLLDLGWNGLQRETLAQFHPDGVNAEQAFGYLPFVWELLLAGFSAGEAAGLDVDRAVRERLAASLEFARCVRLPDGRMPQIGDEDDGRVLLAAEGPSRLDLIGNALAAWLDKPALSGDAPGLALLLSGGAPSRARAAEAGRHEFVHGGYTVWRLGPLLVTFDHGRLGLGALAAHGHADALSVTIFRGADGLVVDPGTLAYHEDAAARDRCRGTPVHSTVSFGGRSQSEMLGPFLWGRRAEVEPGPGGWTCLWAGGERHTRSVEVSGESVTIEDRAEGRNAELAFALAPGATVTLDRSRAIVVSGGSRATFEREGGEAWRVEPSEHGVRFGRRVPAQRLVATIGREARTRIALGPA
jgi:hypothetical protein